ncbi:MAG: hypothetical protein JWL81_315 [Verrucomicrobiales bacterium]|nr:hypothetical protein [Verrucomicrobiales bacterium]
MKKPILLLLTGATALAFSSCTTVVHPTETRTVYRTRTVPVPVKKTYRPAYVAPAHTYDTPESTTVVRPAE